MAVPFCVLLSVNELFVTILGRGSQNGSGS